MATTHPIRLRPLLLAIVTALLGLTLALGVGASQAGAAATPEPVDPDSPFSFSGTVQAEGEPLEGVSIIVSGGDFEQTAVTGADGKWQISVPEAGTYEVTIDVDSLPDGVQLRGPEFETREYEIGSTSTVGVLFPFGQPEATADPSASSDSDASSGSSDSGGGAGEFLGNLYQRTISGLNFGLLLALGAIGITLIYGTTSVNNFAHGELLTFGGLAFFVTTTQWGWPLWIAAIATLVASGALGFLHDFAIFKPLRKRRVGLVQVLIVTIGLSIVMRYMYQFQFGGGSLGLAVSNSAVIDMGAFNLSVSNVVSMGIAVVVLVAVGLFLTRTRIGKATRAVSDNSGLAAASGINVQLVIRIVWILAGVLTGLAGMLYTYYLGGNIRWDTGFTILLLLFASVTLGGLGSAFGALVGAIVVGLATQISTLWIPADLRYAVALIILILVLLLRPQGMLGRKERIG